MYATGDAIAPSPWAGRREWIGLAVLLLASVVYAMDLTVLHLAVPHLSADLEPTSAQLLWIIDIYGFLVAGSLITMGTLGDRIGRRKLLLIGAVGFSVTSMIAAFATSAEMLIAARALMGVAGATVAPSTLSLIFNMFRDPQQRAIAIGMWISAFSAGGAIGPVLGGVLIEFFWWGSVFLLALPVMGLLLALGPRVLPEFRDPDARRLDLLSAVMSLAALLATMFALKETAQDGFGPLPAASFLAGLAIGALFVRRQLTLADPLIDIRLFRIPSFSASLVTNLLGVFVAFGYFLFIAQYLQLVLGLSPLQAGLWSLPSALGFIVSSNLAPRFVRRFRPAFVLGACLALAALALTMLLLVTPSSGLAVLVAASVLVSLALAPMFALTTELIVGAAPPERAGAASAISETGSEVGGAVGIAVLGSAGTAVYRSAVAGGLPIGIPPEAAEVARDTLGGAMGVAQQLPAELALPLIEVAQSAFVQGLHAAAAISAAIAIVAAIVAVTLLRHVGASPDVEQTPEADAVGAVGTPS
jgi:DHA2 family multidrug resistance protein-like MFS transporter